MLIEAAATDLPRFVAFAGDRRVADGDLREVARQIKAAGDVADRQILIFDAETSEPAELDLRGTIDDVLARLPGSNGHVPAGSDQPADARRGPGRPRLGVVAREVTLLPRHWDWLAAQPGGASVALRRLIDEARRARGAQDRARRAKEAAYRFAAAVAGDLPHYEDAMRALFADDRDRFTALTRSWPADIRDHAGRLAASAFDAAAMSATT